MGPTKYAKQIVARSMYQKGKSFLVSYVLLRKHSPDESTEYVALHNFCQSIEIVLKSFLLFKDFDKFQPRLKKPLGHKLTKIAALVVVEYGLNSIRKSLDEELKQLETFYSEHRLRYGGMGDIFIAPKSISRELSLVRIAAAVRLAERKLREIR